MPFLPHEIENKEFVVSFRGYDRDEVRAFLRIAAADYRAALEDKRPPDAAEVESPTTSTGLVSVATEARRSAALADRRAAVEADRLREEAERDARRMVKEAERRAEEVRRAAERTATERLEEVARRTQELRAAEERIGRRLYFLETALELARRDLGIHASISLSFDDEQRELPISAKHYLEST